jgi:glucosyl-3-phosphoglycerate synthase
MADFFQTGVISTLHRLNRNGLEQLESDLASFTRANPVGLVLPALYSEFENPAMRRIVAELAKVNYLKRIVVAVGRASRQQFLRACSFFEGFRTPVSALWMESPAVEETFRVLEDNEVGAGEPGKGRTCWFSFGFLLACGDCEVFALHDCDIRNYDRELLARLVYPVTHPNLGFEFSKGYYARMSDQLHGRVTRLFFTPLLRAIQQMSPEIPYLRFLDSFRYALAGEFAMKADLARVNRIPADWGLEVGVLSEVYRNCALPRICQVDLADNYEHKHSPLSDPDPNRGLRRMARDIGGSLFRTIAQHGVVFGADHFRSLLVYYLRSAQDAIRHYYADALLNGLHFDLHREHMAVNVFTQSLREAATSFLQDPLGAPQIPNWNCALAAVPNVFERLRMAAENLNWTPKGPNMMTLFDGSRLRVAAGYQ